MVLQYAANAGGAENSVVSVMKRRAYGAFAFKRQHRIRPDRDTAVDHAGMDAEKRHCRIGDRADQMVNDPVKVAGPDESTRRGKGR